MINRKAKWPIFIIILALIVGVMTMCRNVPLPNYTGNGESTLESSSSPKEADTILYVDEDTGFSLHIPADWRKAIQDGKVSFIHKESASSVQIEITDYDPRITAVTRGSTEADLITAGGKLLNFQWNGNNSYMVLYQKQIAEDTVMDMVESVHFDRSHIIRVLCGVKDQYYSQFSEIITQMIESINWNPSDPVPEGLHLVYDPAGNFEFAVPNTWSIGVSDGAYILQDQSVGAACTVMASESGTDYEGVSQLDYVNLMNSGRSNFALKTLQIEKNRIDATATYSAQNTQIFLVHTMIANGTHEYSLLFECPTSAYQNLSSLFFAMTQYFRYF